jgi:DUF4097 and DUF4098 domain-containing protein YvlB
MKMRVAIVTMIFLAGPLGFSAQEVKTLSLPAEGIHKLDIDCGAGFLKVHGVDGLGAIEVKAEIRARGLDQAEMKKFIEDHVKLTLENRSGRAVLTSQIKERGPFSFGDAAIDLTVAVPQKIHLSVDDGSGEIDIRDILGNLSIEDGSGGLRVENIQGNLEIDDGSGEIEVRGITGDVKVDDGSGSLSVFDVGGSLTIEDGSGDIDVDGVGKDLVLKETGSGGLHFRNVKGQVIK